MGSRSSEKLKKRTHSLNSNYTLEQIDFKVKIIVGSKKTIKTVCKDLEFVKDPTDLLYHICKECNTCES